MDYLNIVVMVLGGVGLFTVGWCFGATAFIVKQGRERDDE